MMGGIPKHSFAVVSVGGAAAGTAEPPPVWVKGLGKYQCLASGASPWAPPGPAGKPNSTNSANLGRGRPAAVQQPQFRRFALYLAGFGQTSTEWRQSRRCPPKWPSSPKFDHLAHRFRPLWTGVGQITPKIAHIRWSSPQSWPDLRRIRPRWALISPRGRRKMLADFAQCWTKSRQSRPPIGPDWPASLEFRPMPPDSWSVSPAKN